MKGDRNESEGTTAAEFMAELAHDKKFVEDSARREAKRQEREAELRASEKPILDDLRQVGIEVESVWNLPNTANAYPDALPILVDHLEKGDYPDRVMEALGQALAVKPAVAFWDRIETLYLGSSIPGEVTGTAVALAGCATKEHVEDLIRFLSIEHLGESRILFLRPIKKLGGDRGYALLEALRYDETFGREASRLLRRNSKR